MEFSSLLVPFTIGLFSALHCVGMCGGIIGALTLSLPDRVRRHRGALALYVSAYNLGRLTSYALAGALIASVGTRLFDAISPQYGHTLVRLFAALLLIGIGLYLAGWCPRVALIERLGAPLWRRLEPLGQRLLPVRSPLTAGLFGLIWGWLPCGLVYTTLLWTTSAGSAMQGAAYMIAFGLGTLPAVMTTGLLTGWVTRLSRLPRLRQGVGMALILMALASLAFPSLHGGHITHGAGIDPHHVHPTPDNR